MISSVEAIRRSNYFMIIKISSTVKELQEDCQLLQLLLTRVNLHFF